ncbi:hypothetical protein ACLB2K_007108 [Fragaria x ananassa]
MVKVDDSIISKVNDPKSDSSTSDCLKSDTYNPYFIHHPDHPGLVLVSKPLDGNNYASWCRAMSKSLNAKNKLGFVNGTIKAPSKKTNPDDFAA